MQATLSAAGTALPISLFTHRRTTAAWHCHGSEFHVTAPSYVVSTLAFYSTPPPPCQLQATLSAVRAALPNSLLVYRSTPPGHADCQNFSEPLLSPQPLSSLPRRFNWDRFGHQNELAKPLVEAVLGVFWDVNAMTELRADGHLEGGRNDCLHYCMPGPVDTWVQALYNLLMQALP